MVVSRGLVSSLFDRLDLVFTLGISFEDWSPHLSVGAENCRLGLLLESWISHVSIGFEKP